MSDLRIQLSDNQQLSKHLLIPKIIFGALMVSIPIYMFLGQLICSRGEAPKAPEQFQLLIYIFTGLSGLLLLGIPIIRRFLMPPRATEPARLGAEESISTEAFQPLFQKFFSASIISWALSESIAIYGLVITFLLHDVQYIVGFGLLGMFSMSLYFPRLSLFKEILRGSLRP